MEVTGKVYQMNYGDPFILKNIDRLFYACKYVHTKDSFLMDKEKFEIAITKGMIKEYRSAVGF